MLIDPNERVFGSDDFVVQVCKDHLLYAMIERESKFPFAKIKNVTISRSKTTGRVTAITYKVKRELGKYQIDRLPEAQMDEIAKLLKSRAEQFAIEILEKTA